MTHFFLWLLLLYLLSSSIYKFSSTENSVRFTLKSFSFLFPALFILISFAALTFIFKPRYLPLAHFLEYDGSFQYLYFSFVGMVFGTALGIIFPFSMTLERARANEESKRRDPQIFHADVKKPEPQGEKEKETGGPILDTVRILPPLDKLRALSLSSLLLILIFSIIAAPHFDRYLQSAQEIGTGSFSIKMERGDIFRAFDLTNLYLENTASTGDHLRRIILDLDYKIYKAWADGAGKQDRVYSGYNFKDKAAEGAKVFAIYIAPVISCARKVYAATGIDVDEEGFSFSQLPSQFPYPMDVQFAHYGSILASIARSSPASENSNARMSQGRKLILDAANALYGVDCGNGPEGEPVSEEEMRIDYPKASPFLQIYAAYLLNYGNLPFLARQVLESVPEENKNNAHYFFAFLTTQEMNYNSADYDGWLDAYIDFTSMHGNDTLYAYNKCRSCCDKDISDNELKWLADRIAAGEISALQFGNNMLYNYTVLELSKQTNTGIRLARRARLVADDLAARRQFLLDATSSDYLPGKASDARELRLCIIRTSNFSKKIREAMTTLGPASQHTIGMFLISEAHADGSMTRDGLRYLTETHIGTASRDIEKANHQARRQGKLTPSQQRQENETLTHYRLLHTIYREP